MSAARSIDAALKRFERLHPKLIDLGLERVEALLADLGDPHLCLPPVVHIAGTNGKGSLLAFLRAVFVAAGRRVHSYTSPHLIRFNERIELDGAPIGDTALAALLEEVEAINAGRAITQFEITTCAAFVAFARAPADLLLLETGLGGRLDATNVVPRPLATAITPVSVDHENFLGADLAGIAAEKAGILKTGVPAVIAAQEPAAMAAIERRAADIGAPLWLHGRDWHVDRDSRDGAPRYVYRGRRGRLALDGLSLPGPFQYDNAAQAVAVIDAITAATDQAAGLAISDSVVTAGLATARWPARLNRLDGHPYAAGLGAGWQLWLDGGHNAAAGACLAAAAAAWRDDDRRAGPPKPLHLVVGMMATKDAAAFLAPLAAHAERLQAVPIPGHDAALPPAEIAAAAHGLGYRAGVSADVGAAVRALARHGAPARILICGSLYLAGAVLAKE